MESDQTDPEGTVTFNELRQLSYQLATLLKKQGLTAGGSVLVCLENDRWHPIIFLASALLGATTSGVSPLSTPEELRSYAAKCDADVILCTLASLDKVATYLSHVRKYEKKIEKMITVDSFMRRLRTG